MDLGFGNSRDIGASSGQDRGRLKYGEGHLQ